MTINTLYYIMIKPYNCMKNLTMFVHTNSEAWYIQKVLWKHFPNASLCCETWFIFTQPNTNFVDQTCLDYMFDILGIHVLRIFEVFEAKPCIVIHCMKHWILLAWVHHAYLFLFKKYIVHALHFEQIWHKIMQKIIVTLSDFKHAKCKLANLVF